MGKSDPFIFKEYVDAISAEREQRSCNSIAFMGFDAENDLTRCIKGIFGRGMPRIDFFDKARGNWDINAEWNRTISYDLIVCTRCAYFSNDPCRLINELYDALNVGGTLLIDFGLGDHYRFSSGCYAVGWKKSDEHVTGHGSKLNSVLWDDSFQDRAAVRRYSELIRCKGYDDDVMLSNIIRREIPVVCSLSSLSQQPTNIRFVTLWPESPQLYIIASFTRSKDNV